MIGRPEWEGLEVISSIRFFAVAHKQFTIVFPQTVEGMVCRKISNGAGGQDIYIPQFHRHQ